MSWAHSAGYVFSLVLWVTVGLLLVRASSRMWRRGARWGSVTAGFLGVFALLIPHWGTFPGRPLAEWACSKYGGTRVHQDGVVTIDGFSEEPGPHRNVASTAGYLLGDGFSFVEYPRTNRPSSLKSRLGGPVRIRIGRRQVDYCNRDGELWRRHPDFVEPFILGGMRPDECIVPDPIGTPRADVLFRRHQEVRILPTPILYEVSDAVWRESGEPVVETRGFIATGASPVRGGAEVLDCHRLEALSGHDVSRLFRGPQSRIPANVAGPSVSGSREAVPLGFSERPSPASIRGSELLTLRALALTEAAAGWRVLSFHDRPSLLVTPDRTAGYELPPLQAGGAANGVDTDLGRQQIGGVLANGETVLVLRLGTEDWQLLGFDARAKTWAETRFPMAKYLDQSVVLGPKAHSKTHWIVTDFSVMDRALLVGMVGVPASNLFPDMHLQRSALVRLPLPMEQAAL